MFRLNWNKQETNLYFDVSIEPKQTGDQPKQCDREHILLMFTDNSVLFRFFCFFVCFFRFFSVCFETVCFGCFASVPKQRVSMFRLNRNKQKTHPNSLKESIFGYFKENLGLFQFVLVCFGLLRNSSVCFGCFDIGSKHRNKPKLLVFGFTKQTKTNAKQILFRFVSVWTEIYFCLFRGHPRHTVAK